MNGKRSNLINFLIKTCDKVSNAIIRDFSELEKLQVTKKDLGGFVTNADIKAEKIVIRELSYFDPEINLLLEEHGNIVNDTESNSRWIVDAIDGTSNFMRGNPHFCISIALEMKYEKNVREIVAGVSYCPITRDLYWAEKGFGAYYVDNTHIERKIKVSSKDKLSEAIGAVNSVLGIYSEEEKAIYSHLQEEKTRFRITGSTALDMAYVASGKFDFCIHDKVKIWDVAVGMLLIREAGGIVSDFSGSNIVKDNSSMIASNHSLYKKLQKQ